MMKNFTQKSMLALLLICFAASSIMAQTLQQRSSIRSTYDQQKLTNLSVDFAKREKLEKDRAISLAKANGWELQVQLEDGRFAELQKVTEDGYPVYYITYNVDAAKSTRADHLNSGGSLGLNLNGQNMIAHVWDGGLARATHQEYDGPGGNNRFSIGDGSTTQNYHAGHVTGTIIASGVQAAAKGMAPHASAIGYDWNSDLSEATSAASNGMLISNHSYGFRSDLVPDWYFGAYIADSRDWDNLMRNSPYYLMVVAAGNDGNTNYNGSPLNGSSAFDKLTGHSTSKNNMVVANAQDANVANNGDLLSVVINSSSSEGPTDDLRIKPDIAGNGSGVYSTYVSSNSAYNSITGTSMASPNVAGSLLLLQQHANNEFGNFMRAATLKGLALHTADDAGTTGPDAVFGWGLMNTKRAAETISGADDISKIEELSLSNGQTYSITVESDGTSPLLASISWTDLPGTANTGTANNSTPVLINNLDIRVSKSGTTFSPYRLTGVNSNTKGDNNVDPFERVDINNASGTYTITVTHKGTLSGGSQNFSLIVTGISGTPVACNPTVPSGLNATNVGSNSANLTWSAISGTTYDVRYRVIGTSSWTTETTNNNNISLSGLSATTQYEAQVRSKCSGGTNSAYSSSVNFTTTEVQLNYCASNGNSIADEFISRVQIGSINNSSSANSSGYADFTSISTDLGQGDATTITITPTWTGTTYNEGYSVWIDYNQDGDFTDSGEQVWTQSATSSTPVSGSFTVPTGALEGNTRMRVSMKYNGVPSACESFSYGEVEDYTVNISTDGPAVCTTPTSLSTSAIAETTASLNWSNETVAIDYSVRVRATGTSSWSTLSASGNILNVSGLIADTQYEWQVRSNCSGNNSAYSPSSVFTTDAPVAVNYCESEGNDASFEWISRVRLGAIDNSTGSNNGYGDFTNLSADLPRGAATTINVQAAFSGSSYTEFWSIWIDLNQDGVFSTTERLVNGSSSSSNLLSATLNVPSGALTGPTRMRVTMKYNAAATPCEAFAYGEVEDYTVNIVNSSSSMMTTFNDLSNEILAHESKMGIYQLYPNPAQETINVNIRNVNFEKGIQIYSSTGALVKNINIKENETSIDVSGLEKGMYILKASTLKENVSANFVVK